MRQSARWAFGLCACVVISHAAFAVEPASQVRTLVENFTQAQRTFDLAQLSALTADDYVEISPLGEVDPREKMLSFYAPEKKVETPEMKMSEVDVRVHGDSAYEIAKLSYSVKGPDGQLHAIDMRAVYVARNVQGSWKLESSQYTGIRPKK